MPAVSAYIGELCNTVNARNASLVTCTGPEDRIIADLSLNNNRLWEICDSLSDALLAEETTLPMQQRARYYRDTVFCLMEQARIRADYLETITAAKYWPFPTYAELLFQG